MLRDLTPRDEVESELQKHILSGGFAPDDFIMLLVKVRLSEPDCRSGYLLDGFPRTIVQAKAFDRMLQHDSATLDVVFYLDIPAVVSQERLKMRMSLEQRQDDCEKIIQQRLELHAQVSAPLREYYGRDDRLHLIVGDRTVDETTRLMMEELRIQRKIII